MSDIDAIQGVFESTRHPLSTLVDSCPAKSPVTGGTQRGSVTQQNAGNSEELASAAEETAAQATAMRELVGQFKVSQSVASITNHAPAHHSAPRPAPTVTAAAPTPDIPMDDELADF
jgi:hypothetical protein